MSEHPRIIGIDVGFSGAVALVIGVALEAVHDIPIVGKDVDAGELARLIRDMRPDHAFIENATAMPKQGTVSMFRFGSTFGTIKAVVAVCGISHSLIVPSKWKRHYNLLNSDKEASRLRAIQLWPDSGCFNLKKHHGRAESALIAKFGAETLSRLPLVGGAP
jgi:hypothetical protein